MSEQFLCLCGSIVLWAAATFQVTLIHTQISCWNCHWPRIVICHHTCLSPVSISFVVPKDRRFLPWVIALPTTNCAFEWPNVESPSYCPYFWVMIYAHNAAGFFNHCQACLTSRNMLTSSNVYNPSPSFSFGWHTVDHEIGWTNRLPSSPPPQKTSIDLPQLE